MGSIEVVRDRFVAADPAQVFDVALDPALFPSFFQGHRLVPALKRVTHLDAGPLRAGSRRRVESADGRVLEETVLVLAPPYRHRYRITGFAVPFGWWVASAESDWEFTPRRNGVDVRWRYVFHTRGYWSRAVVGIIARRHFATAMSRCLDALATHAEALPAVTHQAGVAS